ncbi:MAG: signal peptidase I [Candidatus Moraniibacteriota bacterium]
MWTLLLLAAVFAFFSLRQRGGGTALYHANLSPQEAVSITGTGSMFPTFPKGTSAKISDWANEIVATPLMYRYADYRQLVGRGDIVSFSNDKTAELITAKYGEAQRGSGFVKRVIGLPGDTLEIKDGFVWINGAILQEPYTAARRSTFGGPAIKECEAVTIPEGSLAVLGDNRKGSDDSRYELGLIRLADIDHILPFAEQGEYQGLWRTLAAENKHDADQPTLDIDQYVGLLNQKRIAENVGPLKYNAKLAASAQKRADVIIRNDDFSYEGEKSGGYTMSDALKEVGYANVIWNEAFAEGYYTADELLGYYMESKSWQQLFLDKRYQDVGLSVELGVINHCPVQVIVHHVGGYVPPHYAASDIRSWKKLLKNMESIRSGWKEWDAAQDFYQEYKGDIKRINEIIGIRIQNSQAIIARMEADQWLTATEEQMVKDDRALGEELNHLIEKINKKARQYGT